MATPFLSSEEYDERAHRYYNQGEYNRALATLKEGLSLYPHAVDLYVGLGYTRLAREEYAWARQAFDKALVLEPDHEDALVGMGEALLRFGRRDEALELFDRVRHSDAADETDLLLSMGRALYRERLFEEAREVFDEIVTLDPESAEAVAAHAYTLHRLGDEPGARAGLARALELDPRLYEARVYLGHLLYDRGEWEAALETLDRVPPAEHWDSLALWRLLELKRTLHGLQVGAEALADWEARLEALEAEVDPIDNLLAEVERDAGEGDAQCGGDEAMHRVRLPDGRALTGSWLTIVRQLRDEHGLTGETVAQFMRRQAEEQRARAGVRIPADDPEAFLRASARAGLLLIEH